MRSLLDRPVVAPHEHTTAHTPSATSPLAHPFDTAHLAAEFRDDRPLWRRALAAVGAQVGMLFSSDWQPSLARYAADAALLGLPYHTGFRVEQPRPRCCRDHPSQG